MTKKETRKQKERGREEKLPSRSPLRYLEMVYNPNKTMCCIKRCYHTMLVYLVWPTHFTVLPAK